MAKKILLTGLVLLGFVFSEAKVCFADAAALLEQAQTYRNVGYWPKAEQIYKAIVTDYPATDYALKVEGELICMGITKKTNEQIQADIDRLTANYSGYPALLAKLCDIAASYGWSSKYEKASSLYKQIIQQYPGSSVVRKAQLGISRINIVSLIESGDCTAVAAE